MREPWPTGRKSDKKSMQKNLGGKFNLHIYRSPSVRVTYWFYLYSLFFKSLVMRPGIFACQETLIYYYKFVETKSLPLLLLLIFLLDVYIYQGQFDSFLGQKPETFF